MKLTVLYLYRAHGGGNTNEQHKALLVLSHILHLTRMQPPPNLELMSISADPDPDPDLVTSNHYSLTAPASRQFAFLDKHRGWGNLT